MAKNNNELQNLKTIHMIQSGGEIQSLLKNLRNGKSTVENLMKSVFELKKESKQKQAPKQEPEVFETPKAPNKEKVAEQNEKPAVSPKPNQDFKQNQAGNRNRSFNNNEKQFAQNQNKGFDSNRQKNFENKPGQTRQGGFNQQGQGQRQGAYNPGQRQGGYNQGGFNQQGQRQGGYNQGGFNQQGQGQRQGGYNQGQRQGGYNQGGFNQGQRQGGYNQGGFNQQGQRQGGYNQGGFGGQRTQGVGFASSKSNTVKVFKPELESARTLVQPERTFGNKNKSKRNYDEKDRSQPAKKGMVSKRNSAILTDDNFEEVVMGSRRLIKNKKKEPVYIAPAIENAVITTETVTVKVLSEKIGKPAAEIIKQLMILGVMATINSAIDFTTAELVASELGITLEQRLEVTAEEELGALSTTQEENENDLMERPPVVAVMGHVDHGKTSLLDIIRKSSVALGEAGGITQSIGAYQVVANDQKITFLDTPGHAAFTSMRARGAKITDVAILVVAADDGIMPQTIEAINHIKAAQTPMIVALNKMDKPEANPDRIKTQLAEHGLLPEEWGGDTILVPVSAKMGMGIDNLLNMILLVAQMQELKANPNRLALGTVIEASLDKARGPMATVLVQNGTLKVGDTIICGITYGKVKAMYDENGKNLKEALPSTPVSVLGLNEVPLSGDQVYAVDEKLSKQVIQERKDKIKTDKEKQSSAVSLDSFMDKVNEGKLKNLNIIIKADSQGSVEALKQSLLAVSNDEVKIVAVHAGVGPVTESDLVLAEASSSKVINFNLKVDSKISTMADSMGIDMKSYKVIYEVVEEYTDRALNLREKVYEKVVVGQAEVRAVFKLSSQGTIAGSYVKSGKVIRNAGARVFRDGEELADTTIDALKIQKDDKAEVNYGYECGIRLKDFTSFKEGDIIEVYQKVEVKR